MPDYSALSDQDLIALHSGDLSKVSDDGIKALHDQQPQPPSGLSALLQNPLAQKIGNAAAGLTGPLAPALKLAGSAASGYDANGPQGAGDAITQRVADQAKMAPFAAQMMLPPGAGKLAQVGAAGVQGIVSGAENYADKGDPKEAAETGLMAGGASLALGKAANLVGEGSGKLGDWLMQKAVGMKKYMPGIGTQLGQEGLIGTKGMMAKQVDQAIPNKEQMIQDATNKLTGFIKPEPVASAISSRANKFIPSSPNVAIPSENEGEVAEAIGRAREALDRGNLTPQEALSTSRAIGAKVYNRGDPRQGFTAGLGQAEAGALKDQLKALAGEQGESGVSEGLKSQAALLTAKRALNAPETIGSALGKHATSMAIGGGLGYLGGGKPGALAGALMTSPIGASAAGQAALKAAPLIQPAAALTLQQVLENARSSK